MQRLGAVIGAALVTRVLLDLSGGDVGAPVSGALLLLVGGLALSPRAAPAPRSVVLAAAAFGLLLLLAAARGTDPLYWTALYGGPAVLALAASRLPTDHGPRWATALALAAALTLAWDAVALATGQPATFVLNGYPRLLGGYANPHTHAVALALFASLGAVGLEVAPSRARPAAAGLLVLSTAFLGFTWVRTAMLMLTVQLVAWLALRGHRKPLAALPVLALLALALSPGLRDRFSDVAAVLSGTAPDGGWAALGSYRGAIWAECWATFSAHGPSALLVGLGTGAHHGLHPKGLDPHSEWLTLWAQGGVLLPVAWYALLATLGVRAVQLAPTRPTVAQQALAHHAAAWALALALTAPLSNDVLPRATLGWAVFALLGLSAGGQPGPEGRRHRDGQVVVDAEGEQLGSRPEDGSDQRDLEAQLRVPEGRGGPGRREAEGHEGQ